MIFFPRKHQIQTLTSSPCGSMLQGTSRTNIGGMPCKPFLTSGWNCSCSFTSFDLFHQSPLVANDQAISNFHVPWLKFHPSKNLPKTSLNRVISKMPEVQISHLLLISSQSPNPLCQILGKKGKERRQGDGESTCLKFDTFVKSHQRNHILFHPCPNQRVRYIWVSTLNFKLKLQGASHSVNDYHGLLSM